MWKQLLQRGASVLAAVATTFVLFHAVAGLADGDRAALYAARAGSTLLAGGPASTRHN